MPNTPLFLIPLLLTASLGQLIKDRVAAWPPLDNPVIADLIDFDVPTFGSIYTFQMTLNHFTGKSNMSTSIKSPMGDINVFMMEQKSMDDNEIYKELIGRVLKDVYQSLQETDDKRTSDSLDEAQNDISDLIIANILHQLRHQESKSTITLKLKDYCAIEEEIYTTVYQDLKRKKMLKGFGIYSQIQQKQEASLEKCKAFMESNEEKLKLLPFMVQPINSITNLVYRMIAKLESQMDMSDDQFENFVGRFWDMLSTFGSFKFRKVLPMSTPFKIQQIVENLSADWVLYLNALHAEKDEAAKKSIHKMMDRLIEVIKRCLMVTYKINGDYTAFSTMTKFFGEALPFTDNEVLMQIFNNYYTESFKGKITELKEKDPKFLKSNESKLMFNFILSLHSFNMINVVKSDIKGLLNNFGHLSQLDYKTIRGLETFANILKSEANFHFDKRNAFVDSCLKIFIDFIEKTTLNGNDSVPSKFDTYLNEIMNFTDVRDTSMQLILKLLNFWTHPDEIKSCRFNTLPGNSRDIITQIKNIWMEQKFFDFMNTFVNFLYKFFNEKNYKIDPMMAPVQLELQLSLIMATDQKTKEKLTTEWYDTMLPIYLDKFFRQKIFDRLKNPEGTVAN
jgi:hypothetical protein